MTTRKGWLELTTDDCMRLLDQHQLGRLVMVDQDGPVVFPMTYVVDGGDILFRTERSGTIAAAANLERVAFEVDGVDEATRTGWSVLVRGVAEWVTDPDDLDRVRTLPLHPWAPGYKNEYVRLRPDKVSGRRITVPEDLSGIWWG